MARREGRATSRRAGDLEHERGGGTDEIVIGICTSRVSEIEGGKGSQVPNEPAGEGARLHCLRGGEKTKPHAQQSLRFFHSESTLNLNLKLEA
jgi:hypothetical protein